MGALSISNVMWNSEGLPEHLDSSIRLSEHYNSTGLPEYLDNCMGLSEHLDHSISLLEQISAVNWNEMKMKK